MVNNSISPEHGQGLGRTRIERGEYPSAGYFDSQGHHSSQIRKGQLFQYYGAFFKKLYIGI